MKRTTETAQDMARGLLRAVLDGRDTLDREGLHGTPVRLVGALWQLTEGYETDLAELVTVFPTEGDAMVVVRDVPFASLCEHHVLPFTGTASVAYVPRDRIIGLSKIPRIVRAITRRLQVQERIGIQIADTVQNAVEPVGVMTVVRARHSCMALRGIESPGEMVTSVVRGCFSEKADARAEALRLFGGP